MTHALAAFLAGLQMPSYSPNWFGLDGHRFTIGAFFELHIVTAGLISGASQAGPIIEWTGYMRRSERHERLARGLAKFLVYYFTISAFLAILVVTVLLTVLWGKAWTEILRVTFWPFYIEAWSFVLMVTGTYAWYYTWDRLQAYKRLHIAIGGLLLIASFLQVAMIDVVASYMLTPTDPSDPIRVFINPTSWPLQVHRTFANLAYIGYGMAGYAAIRYLRDRNPIDRAYHDWMGSQGVIWGMGMTLLQPIVGYSYAKEIQLHTYGAWYKMMRGTLSAEFIGQIALLGVMFVISAWYFARRARNSKLAGGGRLRLIAIGLVLTTIFAALPYHLAFTYDDVLAQGRNRPFWEGGLINPFGAMIPYKVSALIVFTLLSVLALVVYLRGERRIVWGQAGRGEQSLLVLVAACTTVMIVLMGYIRENGRYPDIVAGHVTQQGQQAVQEPPSSYPSGGPP